MKSYSHAAVVLTNALYPLAALFAPTWSGSVFVLMTGLYLGYASGRFHYRPENRLWQEIDIHAMSVYLSSIAAEVGVAGGYLSEWIYLFYAVPIAAAVYYRIEWRDWSSTRHVIGWVAVTMGLLIPIAGWWTLLPISVMGVAGAIKFSDEAVNGWWHALWHVLTWASASCGLYVLDVSEQSLIYHVGIM